MTTKTLYQIVSLLVLALFFIQCSKSDEITTTTKPNQPQLSAFDQKIHNMVNDFKGKLKSDLKSGEIMSIDSALWYVSITLNATYGNPQNGDLIPQKTYIDSITVLLPVNNGSLPIDEISNIYNKIVDSARLLFQKISDNDKQLASIIIDPIANSDDLELTFKVVTYSTWGLQWWEQFGEGETYYFARDDDSGNPVTPNACDKIQAKFSSHVWGNPYMAPYPGYFWAPVEQYNNPPYWDYPYNYNSITGHTNYLDYYLFTSWVGFPGYDQFLCADELNFHLSKIIEFADVIIPQKYNIVITPSYRCYAAIMNYDRSHCWNGDLMAIGQGCMFYYGYRIARPIPPAEL